MKIGISSLLLLIVFFFIFLSSSVGLMNSVDSPQYRLTQSIADNHKINIDKNTKYIYPDYIFYNNHYYSSREPTESLLAIPFYVGAKLLSRFAYLPYNGNNPGIDQNSKVESLTISLNALCAALSVLIIFYFGLLTTKHLYISNLGAISYGLGSLIWCYGGTFQRQSELSFLISSYFALLFLFLLKQYQSQKIYFFLGILIGLSVALDRTWTVIIFLTLPFVYIKSTNHKYIFWYLFGLLLTNFPSLVYYYVIFNNPFTSSFSHLNEFPLFTSFKQAFSSPLASVVINLFSFGPIPKWATSPLLWNQSLSSGHLNFSVNYATTYPYKGIFTQSPYLYIAIISLLTTLRKSNFSRLVILCMAAMTLVYSKLVGYWNPNNYNTRYFLPIVTVLSTYFPLSISYLNSKIKPQYKYSFYLILLIVISISIYFGYSALLSNYGPHITGEHRYIPTNNLNELITNLFPNYQNALFLSTIFLPFFLIICAYLSKKYHRYLKTTQNISL